jgi:hypothetical protein
MKFAHAEWARTARRRGSDGPFAHAVRSAPGRVTMKHCPARRGGISSSIDESIHMVQRIVEDITGDPDKAVEASRAVQLAIQYHPGPRIRRRRGAIPTMSIRSCWRL